VVASDGSKVKSRIFTVRPSISVYDFNPVGHVEIYPTVSDMIIRKRYSKLIYRHDVGLLPKIAVTARCNQKDRLFQMENVYHQCSVSPHRNILTGNVL
jgi:hypothetical protein